MVQESSLKFYVYQLRVTTAHIQKYQILQHLELEFFTTAQIFVRTTGNKVLLPLTQQASAAGTVYNIHLYVYSFPSRILTEKSKAT